MFGSIAVHDQPERATSALAEARRRQETLQLYGRLAGLLRLELDVEPEPETHAIYERLRRG